MAIFTSLGTPTANSYVSVASANTYFESYYQSDAWDEISGATGNTTASRVEKEGLLIQATREIDNTYRFFQEKYNVGIIGSDDYQNLQFPRSGNTDNNGDLFIPPEVKEATYQQALWLKLRRNPRVDKDNVLTNLPFFAKESFNYLKGWVNLQVRPVNRPPWMGSNH